jgi:hypothetical protein
MTKYGSRNKPEMPKLNREVHPVMRGIGCIMMVVVPVLSYLAATVIVPVFPIPLLPGMTKALDVPPWLYNSLSGLQPLFNYIETQPLFVSFVVFALALSILIFSIMSIVYGFIYKAFGPSQYGPMDEPPIRKKVKKYTR